MVVGIAINRSWNIYNFRQGIIRALIRAGNQVIAIAPRDEYVGRLEALGCVCEHIPMTDTGSNPISEFQLIVAFDRIIKKHQIDVLLTYTIKCNLYGSVAASRNGVPCICNISGLGTAFLSNGFSSIVARFLSRRFLKTASHLFFQNADDKADFLDSTSLHDVSHSMLPGSGIDLKKFRSVNEELPNKFQFLLLARLIVEKGVREYAEAAAIVKKSHPDVSFLLVGSFDEGHSRSVSQSELQMWQDRGWLEYLPHRDDIADVINQVEVVVLPSYREGTPRSLLEGAACARPLITTDVPGCREVVTDGVNGFLSQVRSAKHLANQMLKYLDLMPEEKMKMGQASRKMVEYRYDEKHVIKAYLDKIKELT